MYKGVSLSRVLMGGGGSILLIGATGLYEVWPNPSIITVALVTLFVGIGLVTILYGLSLYIFQEYELGPNIRINEISKADNISRVRRLEDDEAYEELKDYLDDYPHFMNTLLEDREMSDSRKGYYEEKLRQIRNGDLESLELYSSKNEELIRKHKRKLLDEVPKHEREEVKSRFDARKVDMGGLPHFQDFCIFIDSPEPPYSGVVFMGWFHEKNPSRFQRQSCLLIDSDEAVQDFAQFFEGIHQKKDTTEWPGEDNLDESDIPIKGTRKQDDEDELPNSDTSISSDRV